MRTYRVSGRPTAPGSKLPVCGPLIITAPAPDEATRLAIPVLGVINDEIHRYRFSAELVPEPAAD
ncbi:MAG: hypothetical protein ABIK89_13195 [Planctomycetota bacterium]